MRGYATISRGVTDRRAIEQMSVEVAMHVLYVGISIVHWWLTSSSIQLFRSGLTPEDFNDHPPIASGHFLVNLQREEIRRVLNRWVDCGVLDCRTCMAPIGSSKNDPNGAEDKFGINEYVSHRQDQSVLTLLVTSFMKDQSAEANVKIIGNGEESPYFCIETSRNRGDIKSVKDWNTTFTIPPHACKTVKSTILKYRNNIITWEDEDLTT